VARFSRPVLLQSPTDFREKPDLNEMSHKPYSPRERAIFAHGRKIEREVQERLRAEHRIVIRVSGRKVVDSTIAELREKERERDGPGGYVHDCTMIELPLTVLGGHSVKL
jgi:hypothetical protein